MPIEEQKKVDVLIAAHKDLLNKRLDDIEKCVSTSYSLETFQAILANRKRPTKQPKIEKI